MDVRLAHEAATTLVGLLLEKDPVRVEMFVERGHLLRRRGNACHRRGCHLYWNDSRCDGDDDAICPHAIPPPENRKRQALAKIEGFRKGPFFIFRVVKQYHLRGDAASDVDVL
jgi:hypothetical protein